MCIREREREREREEGRKQIDDVGVRERKINYQKMSREREAERERRVNYHC